MRFDHRSELCSPQHHRLLSCSSTALSPLQLFSPLPPPSLPWPLTFLYIFIPFSVMVWSLTKPNLYPITHKTKTLSELLSPVILLVYLTHENLQKLCTSNFFISMSLCRLPVSTLRFLVTLFSFLQLLNSHPRPGPHQLKLKFLGESSHPFSYLYIFTAYLFESILSRVPNNFPITKPNQSTSFCFSGLMCFYLPSIQD